ncbi:MAG TPA: HAMP domain-containing sensor histidine kinase, partial [Streptosporangiaceae bacterium]
MQRRLLFSTLAVAVVAVLLLGLPLAFVLSRLQAGEAGQELRRDATTLATGLQERVNSGLPADATQVARSLPDRYVTISQRGTRPIVFGSKPPPGDTITGRASSRDFAVTVAADDSFVAGRIVGGLVLIGSLSLLAVAAAVVLALFQARRLTRPMLDLARAADLLGSGAARPLGRRYGLPELDRVAEGLDGSAQRIAELLSAERAFAVDASHQLRTPLTALSMRLEEITVTEELDTVKEEAAIALAQVERLTDVVERLLTNSRDPRTGSAVSFDLDEVIKQQIEEWRPAYRSAGRAIINSGKEHLKAVGTPGAVAQVLAAL